MKTLLIFTLVLAASTAYTFREIQDLKPGQPKQCEYGGKKYDVGDWQVPSKCLKITCSEGSEQNKMQMQGLGCGAVAESEDCKIIKGDPTLPYPQCCPKPIC